MIKRIVKLTFRPEHIEEFKAIFAASKSKIKAFEGCQHVELLQATADETIFFTLSLWEADAALENYRRSPLFATTWSKTKRLFADRPEAWSVELVDTAE